MTRVFLLSLLSHNFDDRLSSNFPHVCYFMHMFRYTNWEDWSWQLPIVSTAFKSAQFISWWPVMSTYYRPGGGILCCTSFVWENSSVCASLLYHNFLLVVCCAYKTPLLKVLRCFVLLLFDVAANKIGTSEFLIFLRPCWLCDRLWLGECVKHVGLISQITKLHIKSFSWENSIRCCKLPANHKDLRYKYTKYF